MLEFTFVYGENGYALSRDLRDNVFGTELTDGYEEESYHLVGYDKTRQIAAGRFTMVTDTVCHIDFVAVSEDYRRQFVGDLVIKAIEDKAKSLGAEKAILDAPLGAVPFFEFEHYEDAGSGREKYGQKCRVMQKDLTKVYKCRGCV